MFIASLLSPELHFIASSFFNSEDAEQVVWSLMILVEIVRFCSLIGKGNILSGLKNSVLAAFLKHLVSS